MKSMWTSLHIHRQPGKRGAATPHVLGARSKPLGQARYLLRCITQAQGDGYLDARRGPSPSSTRPGRDPVVPAMKWAAFTSARTVSGSLTLRGSADWRW